MKTLLKKGHKFELNIKREYSVFQFFSFSYRFVDLIHNFSKIDTAFRFEYQGDKWGTTLVREKDWKEIVNNFVNFIELQKPFLELQKGGLESTGDAFVEKSKNIAKIVEIQKYKANIQELFKEYLRYLNEHAYHLWLTFLIPEAGNIVFAKLLEKYVPTELRNEAISIYSHPSQKAHLLRLADALSERPDLESRVKYIKENYPWIFTTDLFSSLPTEDQYLEYARTFRKPEHIEKSSKEFFPKEVLPIISTYQDILYLKDHRDEFRRKAFFYIQPLVEETIRRYKISRDDLWYVLPHEFEKFETDREGILKDISERKLAYIFETDGERSISFQGKEAVKNFVKIEDNLNVKEIKGVIGAPGKIRGEVQVIHGSKDLKNFKKGRILVTNTTNPDYIIAMQKAVAFVTNEGGITCHAAITARELKKPCIVGSKIATRVLRDGDTIEVDADSGIVRIVNS